MYIMYTMSPRIGVSIENRAVFEAVVKLAGTERRTLSSMAAILIEQGLKISTPEHAEILSYAEQVGVETALACLKRAARKAA
jgi:hypothetical protein